jgi:2-polyprenyl-3-methyl-5-hydroxy-6-metoxy-1,4-benzoquinol methylase
MMEVSEIMNTHYNQINEDARLTSRRGQVEYLTTLKYIKKYLKQGMKIIEIGAGTGCYSHYFAQNGYEVDAIELVQYNIDMFKKKTQIGEKIAIELGNALDLSKYKTGTYDITLLLGPMYHLFDRADKSKALSEAIRVTKKGGIIFIAYCIQDASIIQYGFVRDGISALLEKGLLDPITFKTTSCPAEIFELHRKEDIDELISNFKIKRLHYVAADLFANYISSTLNEMDDSKFNLFMDYHYTICERPDMVGITNHVLDILQKEE